MVIRQGEVYWVDLGRPIGSAPGYVRPCIVIQIDALNRSDVGTVIVCPVTSNLRRASAPGNVFLRAGEGNLPRDSVANASGVVAVDKGQLGERLGALPRARLRQVIAGVHLITRPP